MQQTETQITICQEHCAKKFLRKLGNDKAHAVGNHMEVNMRLLSDDTNNKHRGDTGFSCREAIEMMLYLATSTRSTLAFVVSKLSQFVADPH